MAQQFKQFVYCGDSNYTTDGLTKNLLTDAQQSIFNRYTPITQLGIQAPPGTKFSLNYSSLPVIVGFTGIFQVDLSAGGTIESIIFDKNSIDYIEENNCMLIIDIIYEGEE